jgi:hypothetical protein
VSHSQGGAAAGGGHVAGIDVHKDMIKVAIRSPGDKPWTRKTEIFEFRTFYGVLQEMARELRRRGVPHTLLKIAYQVLKTGTPYTDLGADFYTRRESPEHKQAWLERQLGKLHPGCIITITISPPEAALTPALN